MIMRKLIIFILTLLYFTNFAQSINVENLYTKQVLTYNEVNTWVDGSVMDDSKIDGVVFIKKNSKYYKLFYIGNLNAQIFGVKGDDNLDDSKAIQAAINYAIKTSQNLIIPSGRYYIDDTILIPQHFHYSMKSVKIDFSNATLIVRKDVTLFQSANWNTKEDSKMSNGIVLSDFEIKAENVIPNSYAIKIQDYHQGSKIENVSSFNIKNLLHSKNGYYLELYNINSNFEGRAGKRFLFEGYHGLNKFSKLTAVNSDICYTFEGGMVAALDMENISIEGCRIGFNFSSEVYNFHLQSSYFENFDIGMVFSNYIHSASIDNNYINFLNNEKTYLLEYKGLPANNIHFNKGNSYVGTTITNLVKNKEDVYGKGIVFEFDNLNNKSLHDLKERVGKNIKINLNN